MISRCTGSTVAILVTAVGITACGMRIHQDPIEVPDSGPTTADPMVLSTGENNAVRTGGYWWTYTDHNASDSPYHATVSPMTSATLPLQPEVDVDPAHGRVFRILGQVPPELPWTLVASQDPVSIDYYWQSIYPDSMIPAYPAAGIGFGFLYRNAPFDATGDGRWVGVVFDLKLNANSDVIWVSMPMADTDLPDPNSQDAFQKTCQYYTVDNAPTWGGSSCFSHYRTGLFSANSVMGIASQYNLLADVGMWQRYCVLYSQVEAPGTVNYGSTLRMMPEFDPTQLLKITWDVYQPKDIGSIFDMSLDNVRLITKPEARDVNNHCDQSMIGKPPHSADAGLRF